MIRFVITPIVRIGIDDADWIKEVAKKRRMARSGETTDAEAQAESAEQGAKNPEAEVEAPRGEE